MNKVRIVGLIMIILGLLLEFTDQNENLGFLTGFSVGAGIPLLITGQITFFKKK